ncbi:phosphatase PAP2 family protein [Hahella sp. HN01]|uniref:phosphatase PAP2 family protein n=1 Tax=Hahella sp. HN01 TaxID=2847262 RepID=UPI001C1EAF3E|nr:phosphatase PAP2 family protein [Hahella sp. HN01]MBU6951399.1 phosphatase PAP2 family protein [Hahella sp. HN01]
MKNWQDDSTDFYRTHFWYPLLAFLALIMLINDLHLDLSLADAIYSWEGHQWFLRDAWVTSDLLHNDGRRLVAVMAVVLLALLSGSFFVRRLRPYRRALVYLFASVAISLLSVSLLKRLTQVNCPWDLLRYGGAISFDAASQDGQCFPAGHASGGYAWIGLYFVALVHLPRWRFRALGFALALGASFGVAQQLRGAHFISHDIWTLAICWFVALGGYRLAFPHSVAVTSSVSSPQKAAWPRLQAASKLAEE